MNRLKEEQLKRELMKMNIKETIEDAIAMRKYCRGVLNDENHIAELKDRCPEAMEEIEQIINMRLSRKREREIENVQTYYRGVVEALMEVLAYLRKVEDKIKEYEIANRYNKHKK